jgi:hypothetical protein
MSKLSFLPFSLLFWGCADPMDVVGVGEVVSETRKSEPLQDDRLRGDQPAD